MLLYHRHILYHLLKATVAAVALFSFVLIAGNAIREILAFLLDGRMDISLFLQLLTLLLPYVISYALPLGMLLGVLSVLGRMCSTGEYTAYRASGISLSQLTFPFFLLAIIGVVSLVGINLYYAPAARASYYSTLASSIRSDPLRFIIPQTFVKEFPGYILYARERSGNTLTDFWIWELDTHNRPLKLIRAKTGRITYSSAADSLTLELRNGFSELRDAKNPDDLRVVRPTLSFDSARVDLPLGRIVKGENQGNVKLNSLTLPGLLAQSDRIKAQFLPTNTPQQDKELRASLSAIRYQIQQNLAFACAVFSLTLVGIPLGLRVSRRENTANLAFALILALGYYFLVVVTSWFSKNPALHPEVLVWLPNVIFIIIGFILFRRANAH